MMGNHKPMDKYKDIYTHRTNHVGYLQYTLKWTALCWIFCIDNVDASKLLSKDKMNVNLFATGYLEWAD
jgi:hypothetical protein